MKKVRKILVMLLSMIMLFATAIPAHAADTYTITVNGKEANHTYEAYQIFSGEATTNSNSKVILSSPKWTTNISQDDVVKFITEVKASETFRDADSTVSWFETISAACSDKTAQDFATVMTTKFPANATAVADEFAKIAAKYFAKAGVTPTASATSDTKTYVINNVPAGYYLVKDKDSSLNGSNSVYTKYLLDVVGPSTINVKVGETTLDKTVSNTENGNYTEGVQANVGDTVYFELTATLPEYTSSYKTFKLKFTDTLSAGLTFGSVVSAKITDGASETTLTENTHYTLDKSGLSNNGGGTFVLETKDLKGIDKNLQFGDKVVIKYSATLNSNAVIGGNGNLNTAVLNYTNNPYDESTSTPEGTTPQNNAFVFTYNLDATKIDKADENKDLADALKLGGAEFIVYKEVTTEGVTVKHYATKVENNVITEWTPATSYASEELAEEAAAKFVSADSTGLFKVGGLASGTYFLKETKAPSGYNKLTAPIKFQIIAQVESNTSADTASTKSLSIDISNKVTNSADKTNVTATIVNGQGTTLPTTGGIGTTVFYVIGAFLILGASIMFIVKKRTSLE